MYESITYTEIKNLPKEQKSDAWKELKTLYPTQKELAEKLGVSPNLVYNMISRYAKDEASVDKKVKKLKVVDKPKKTRSKAKKQDNQEQVDAAIDTQTVSAENSDVVIDTFSIALKKVVCGEDAQFLLNGIGSTLLKNQKYTIEVKITEK